MFIQTESTPNPATLKFLPGREVMGMGRVADFDSQEAAARSPLARALFEIPQVGRVFFGADFISVTKKEGEWKHLKPGVLAIIMEHFSRELPLLEVHSEEPNVPDEADSDVVAQIKDLIETRVRPAVAQDGGDIVYHGFDAASGVVFLHMRGSCAGCPSATMTLRNGIENLLKHYIPEVSAVEAV